MTKDNFGLTATEMKYFKRRLIGFATEGIVEHDNLVKAVGLTRAGRTNPSGLFDRILSVGSLPYDSFHRYDVKVESD